MFNIPGYKSAGPAEAPDVKDNDTPKTNYLTIDPDSGTDARRVWTANPRTVAKEDVLQYSAPTPSRDTQGKTLPQYRMGIGHRILGTLTNFANGFAGRGANPVYVGPGALNHRYYQDEQERQQNLAGAKLRLGTLANEPTDEPQPETTEPEDTPPPLNENIPPVNPAAREQTSGGKARPSRDEVDWRTVAQNPITGRWVGRTYSGRRKEVPGPRWNPSALTAGDEEDREGEE